MEPKLSFLIFWILFVTRYSNAKLRQVFHVARHGARTPSSFEFKPNQYIESAGELTVLGRFQHYQLGQEFQRRYIQESSLLSDVFNSSEIVIKASGKSRVVFSAYAFVNGLYPQTNSSSYKNIYKESFNLEGLLPIQTSGHKVGEFNIEEINIDESWAQQIIQILPTENDLFFHADQGNNCPMVKKRIDQLKMSSKIQMLETDFKSSVYEHIAEVINTALGKERLSAKDLTIQTAKRVLDNYRCNSFHNVEHPKFNETTLELLERVRYTFIYEVLYKDDLVKSIAATKLVEDIYNHVSILREKNDSSKLVFYAAHDHNIEGILSLLVDEKELEERKFFMVEFASVLSLEIHEEDEDFFVKFFYNDEPLNVKQCKGNICSFQEFEEVVRRIVVPDLEKFCKV